MEAEDFGDPVHKVNTQYFTLKGKELTSSQRVINPNTRVADFHRHKNVVGKEINNVFVESIMSSKPSGKIYIYGALLLLQ